MAGEEGDSELRDLVAQTLESQGVLGKIRAQLRASVFLALEQQDKNKTSSQVINDRFNSFMQTNDGHLTASLVREFLQFFDLDFTCSVFDPETDVLSHFNGREKLATDLNLSSTSDSPLLLQLLKRARSTPPPILLGTETKSSVLATTPTLSLGQSPASLVHPSSITTSTTTSPVTFSSMSTSTPISSSLNIPSTSRQPTPSTVTLSSSTFTQHASSLSFSSSTVTSSYRSTAAITSTVMSSSTAVASTGINSSSVLDSKLLLKSSEKDQTLDGLGLVGGVSSLNPPISEPSLSSLLKITESSKKSNPTVGGAISDDESEEVSESQKWETSDHSLSQTSNSAAGDFDYTEHIQ